MPLEMLYEGGLLLAAVTAAFSISAVVGMLVACLWTPPCPPDSTEDGMRPRRSRSDGLSRMLAEAQPSTTLAQVDDPVT